MDALKDFFDQIEEDSARYEPGISRTYQVAKANPFGLVWGTEDYVDITIREAKAEELNTHFLLCKKFVVECNGIPYMPLNEPIRDYRNRDCDLIPKDKQISKG